MMMKVKEIQLGDGDGDDDNGGANVMTKSEINKDVKDSERGEQSDMI